ncbi:hypothetical protein MTR67_025118 [Solanum verrucosum]|uniref:Uncharacterized protein n=1 Tax=Solanum verrucosum TaxID=315347 RepID=A0AAF0TZ94_SOLVR|nr:hypothetical protein MTR67_025118 [Solanum verrucosum]
MRAFQRILTKFSQNSAGKSLKNFNFVKPFSTGNDWSANFGGTGSTEDLGWDAGSNSWSTGLTKEHFDGEVVGRQMGSEPNARSAPSSGGFGSARWTDEEMDKVKELHAENRKGKAFVDGWDERMKDMSVLMKQNDIEKSRYGTAKDISDNSFVPSRNVDRCTPIDLNLVLRIC